MEIKINTLRLRNFKGVRDASYHLGGRNARLEGPNGSGKSTVFDAFTWLLFGKDHRDQTTNTFELKTIDPSTGRPYPREDHWVEAELTVDGQPHTLRRCWNENWVKPAGAVDDVLKGHTSSFYVDGVDVGTKLAYDTAVASWLKEDSFKLLTNPHYFIDDAFTAWKDRRRALLDLVKDDPGRVRVREEFADVVDKLSGRSIEDYRKRLALEKAANKRDLAQVLSRIDGMREALPEETGGDAAAARLAQLKDKRDAAVAALRKEADALDRAIASADEADAARKAENAAIWAEITKLQLEMGNYLTEAKKGAQTQNNDRENAILAARHEASSRMYEKSALEAKEKTLRDRIDEGERDRGRLASRLADLGEEYKAQKALAFHFEPQDTCPYCGQAIPAATIAEAREKEYAAFVEMQKGKVAEVIDEAKRIKAQVAGMDAALKALKDDLAEVAAKREQAVAEYDKWTAEAKQLEAQPVADVEAAEAAARATEDYKAYVRKEQELRSRALKTGSRADDAAELVAKRKDIEARIQAENDRYAAAEVEAQQALSVGKVRQDQLNLIRQKESEAKGFADAVANCERLEARAAEFVKADIDSVETAINGLFRVARWKMFDTTIDGGIVEMCDVTSPEGVPYKSMNDAMKILCGLDVIRVFGERYGCVAPIFIDNAEGILRDRFDTPAQVIRLVVKDTDRLTLVTE